MRAKFLQQVSTLTPVAQSMHPKAPPPKFPSVFGGCALPSTPAKTTAPPTDVVMEADLSQSSDASCSSDGRIPVSGVDGNVRRCSIPKASGVPMPYFLSPCARGWHWKVPLPCRPSASWCHTNGTHPLLLFLKCLSNQFTTRA